MSRNDEVARLFEEFADRLEATGVEYKPRAYRRAAENLRDHPDPVDDLADEGVEAVKRVDGVGDALAAKAVEYVETGEIAALSDLRAAFPADVDALTTVEGVGPKTAGRLYDALGVETLDDLEAAAAEGRVREVDGFGPKTEEKILDNVPFARRVVERTLLGRARPVAEAAVAHLEAAGDVERCAVAGSVRRWAETVGDANLVAAAADPAAAVEALAAWDRTEAVLETTAGDGDGAAGGDATGARDGEAGSPAAGPRTGGTGGVNGPEAGENGSPGAVGETVTVAGAAVVRAGDVRVDLRVVPPAEFGAALLRFTGSEAHTAALRDRAGDRDDLAGADEAGVYAALDLPWIPPELREGRDEVELAAAGDLPDLVGVEDLRGDLHVHTDRSDGTASAAEMVAAAAAAGHDYVAITDHATGPGVVGGMGLSDDDLRDQLAAVEAVAADADVEVFAGVEANVAADGGVSVGDDVLAALDLVVASPHSALSQDRETATDRLVAAVEHPSVDVLGHPTGRMLHRRPGLDVDVERVAAAAADAGVALEVNANPARLDLGGEAVRAAVEAGAAVAVNTDAHAPDGFGTLRYGVHTARRGGAEAGDVLNTRSAAELRAFLH